MVVCFILLNFTSYFKYQNNILSKNVKLNMFQCKEMADDTN